MKARYTVALFLLATLYATSGLGQNKLILKRDWIEQYKNSATITAHCLVDKVHKKPNPGAKDGDLHMAVRCPDDVDLNTVAEIMNAATMKNAVDLAHSDEGSGKPETITGAWRIWPEHGGSDKAHDQTDPETKPFDTTNPDHVFEIHPISKLGKIDTTSTFMPIPGFTPKTADDAFGRYERTPFVIDPHRDAVTMTFPMVGYNYVKFVMVLTETPKKVPGGLMAFASVDNLDGDMLARKLRMVFVDGTEPADAVAGMKKDECLTVLGIPRVDLALVSWRVQQAEDNNRTDVLTWSMPYEMIVVGVFKDKCQTSDD